MGRVGTASTQVGGRGPMIQSSPGWVLLRRPPVRTWWVELGIQRRLRPMGRVGTASTQVGGRGPMIQSSPGWVWL